MELLSNIFLFIWSDIIKSHLIFRSVQLLFMQCSETGSEMINIIRNFIIDANIFFNEVEHVAS